MNLDKQIQRLLCCRYTIPQRVRLHHRWATLPVKINARRGGSVTRQGRAFLTAYSGNTWRPAVGGRVAEVRRAKKGDAEGQFA